MIREAWLTNWYPERGDVLLDVGANTGQWTRQLAADYVAVHAIEPNPRVLPVLKGDLPANVVLHEWAAWSCKTEKKFHAFENSEHLSAFMDAPSLRSGRKLDPITLPCRPLDKLDIRGKVDLIKCDVEGAELEVLLGAKQLIGRDRPALLIEVHSTDNFLAVTRLLAGWSYLFTVVRHPRYTPYAPDWYSHCWISAQPAAPDNSLFAGDDVTRRSSRIATLSRALMHLHRRRPTGASIVEIGTIRSSDPCHQASDGASTYVFGKYAQTYQGQVTTVDQSAEALDTCRRVTRPFADHISYVQSEGRRFLTGYRDRIDLLYLDGPYEEDSWMGAKAHLEFFQCLTHEPDLVLVDDVFDRDRRGKGELLIPHLLTRGYREIFLDNGQALYGRAANAGPPMRPGRGTLYIAANNCLERGYFLGDVLVLIKTAWLFVQNQPHQQVILSLHHSDPLNFLWQRFVRENRVQVVYDRWDKGSKERQFAVLDERRRTRMVEGMRFDTYRELYPRLDGGHRQHALCGRENGLGRRNIFEYHYYGQESWSDRLSGSDDFGPGVIDFQPQPRTESRSVMIVPHEKCQGNRHFTLRFWEQVCRGLLDRDIQVTVNDRGSFFRPCRDPRLVRTFEPFRRLMEQLARQRLVVCGNTGIGWAAAAVGTPFIALERDLILAEYSFQKCGCRSLVQTIDTPDPALVVAAIERQLDRQQQQPSGGEVR